MQCIGAGVACMQLGVRMKWVVVVAASGVFLRMMLPELVCMELHGHGHSDNAIRVCVCVSA